MPFAVAEVGEAEPPEDPAPEMSSIAAGDAPVHRQGERRAKADPWAKAVRQDSFLHSPEPSPEARLLTEEVRAQIRSAIEALPSNQRVVITLRDLEGRSSEEVCNILGLSGTNQRVLLHRARSRVRTRLAAYLQEG